MTTFFYISQVIIITCVVGYRKYIGYDTVWLLKLDLNELKNFFDKIPMFSVFVFC